MSFESLKAVDETVPPVPLVWKNCDSLNSQASAECATNTDRFRVLAPDALHAQKKNVFASWRSVSPMLPDTSSAKITAAFVAGRSRTSCRNRKSSSVKGRIFLDRAPPDRLLDRAPAIEPRTHAAFVPAFAHELSTRIRAAFGLEIGQLQLFPQPVENVLDLSSSTNW